MQPFVMATVERGGCVTHIQLAAVGGGGGENKMYLTKHKPISASHNQFLNASTAESVVSITRKPITTYLFILTLPIYGFRKLHL